MKNIALAFSIFTILIFSACEKDDPSPVVQPPPPFEEPEPEDTVSLKPFVFVPGDTTHGFVQGIWQDSFLWEASSVAYWHTSHPTASEEYIAISMENYEATFGILRQLISFREIPKQSTGTYLVSEDIEDYDNGFVGASLTIFGDDGDVFEGRYEVNESAADNEIIISEIDIENNIYRGKFTVSFEKVWGNADLIHPSFVKIKDAEFWAKILE